MYYTYAYLRKNRTPYYIGKGTGDRSYVPHKRKNGIDFKPKNKNQILILKKFDNEKDAYLHEEYLIFLYGLKINGGLLINMTNGGDGGGHIKYSLEEREEAYYKKYKERRDRYKERERDLERKRREENRDYYNEKSKEYYAKNKEKNLEKRRKYRENNREKINDRQRQRRNENKEKVNAMQNQYRENNRERIRERDREYYAKNKEKITARKRELKKKLDK